MNRLWISNGLRIVSAMVIAVLLTGGVVYADLKATAEVDAWDVGANPPQFAHSQVVFPAGGTWMPFAHQLNFDEAGFDWQAFNWSAYYIAGDLSGWDGTYPGACTGTDQTKWEGVMHWGLYHEDNSPAGKGFQETRDWSLVNCDRDGSGSYDNPDKRQTPADDWPLITAHPSSEITLLRQDYVDGTLCGGNCESEIVTSIFVSLDTDCDGLIDDDAWIFPTGGGKMDVCFFGEARTPDPGLGETPVWSGTPLQARISTGGAGDKTVNFQVSGGGTTAVTLASFTAGWAEATSQPVVAWVALAAVAVALLRILAWRLPSVRR